MLLRNELKERRAVSHDIKTKSYILRTESQNLRSEKQTPQNESLMLRNESQNLRSEGQELRNNSQKLRNESQELKSEAQAIRKMSQVLTNESKKLRSMIQTLQNESLMLRNKSRNLRSEAQAFRNESFLARSESQNAKSEAQAIRIRSQVLRQKSQTLRNKIFKSCDKENIVFNDSEDVLDATLFGCHVTVSSSDEEYVIDDNKTFTDLDKTNELIDHVNLLAKTRNDFSKNVCKICELLNELQDETYNDDSWLRLVELNKINTLLGESLDYVWKMVYDGNREKHEKIDIDKDKDIDGYVSKYTDIINDKLELVNKIGELLDNLMADVQNVVDMVRETDNKILIHDIPTNNLK